MSISTLITSRPPDSNAASCVCISSRTARRLASGSEVRLWQLPRPGFNWSPVFVERLNGPLARLALYPDITKAGQPEQVFEPLGICQREGEVKRVMLIRQMAAEDIGEDAPHRGPVRGGDDTDCGTPTRTQDAPELYQPPRGIWEELQAKLAHDGVKAAVPECQRLAVRGYGLKRRIVESGARRCEHGQREVSANHESCRFNYGQRDQRGLAWSRGDI